MKGDKDLKNHILWCVKQRRGIKLEEPNGNLCNVYIKKAKSALNMLSSANEKNEVDWIAATAYYARYFAFYGLLQKCGIKSEIHDCTISLMKFLYVGEKMIEEHFYKELQSAKELRVDTQYYAAEELDKEKLKTDSETARDFVLEIERVIDDLTEEKIEKLRNKIDHLESKD